MTTNGIVVGFEHQPHEAPQESELTSEQRVAQAKAAIARGEKDSPGLLDDALDNVLTRTVFASEGNDANPDPNAVDDALDREVRIYRHGCSDRQAVSRRRTGS